MRSSDLVEEVRPWKPVYWREEPVGYQVRYRSRQEGTRGATSLSVRLARLSGRYKHAPVLSPRRQRRIAPEVRPFESLRQKTTGGSIESSVGSHAACGRKPSLGRRPDSTSLLIELLERRARPLASGARALGRRRVKEAVPPCWGVLLGSQDTAAADALGRIGDRRALGPLLTLLVVA